MTPRQYSAIAPQMVLQSGITSASTTIVVDTTAGLPGAYPYTLVIDAGVGGEEIVTVTNASGTTLTVTRGQDGSTATSHSAGAVIRHMMTARDLAEPQQHIAATNGVHGATGSVVGTSDVQTLTNKSISGSSNTLTNLPGAAVTGANSVPKSTLPATVVYTTDVQTLTNKTLTSPAITTPTGMVKGDVGLGNVDNTSDATKNAATVTLTNKTISGASNTLTNLPGANIVGANSVPKSVLPPDAVYNVDTGKLTGASFGAATGNWTISANSYLRVKNGVAELNLEATRINSALSVNANGNFFDESIMVLAAGTSAYWPTSSHDLIVFAIYYNSGAGGVGWLNTAGNLGIGSGLPNTDFTVGNLVQAHFTWLVP